MSLRRVLASFVATVALTACSSPGPAEVPSEQVLTMTQPRAVHRATLLPDGRVLVTGGCTQSGCDGFDAGRRAEVYDEERGLVPDAEMETPRASGTATLLDDGRVLLAGGYPGEGRPPTASAEVYDPQTHSFSPVGDLTTPVADHSATLLPDGQVLLAGGFDASGSALASTQLFDPTTDRFLPGPPLPRPRADHVAVLAGSDLVLLGGTVTGDALSSTEVLDVREGTWRRGPDLATPRVKMGAVAVDDRRVFVVGGATDTEGRHRLRTTELIDLGDGSVSPGPDLAEGEYKLDGAVALLADGRIVVGGGSALDVVDARLSAVRRVEVPDLDARSFRTVTAVGPDAVLVLGGYDDGIEPTDAAYLVTIPT